MEPERSTKTDMELVDSLPGNSQTEVCTVPGNGSYACNSYQSSSLTRRLYSVWSAPGTEWTDLPQTYRIPKGAYAGLVIRVLGCISDNAKRFSINLQCGPTLGVDDIVMHSDFRFSDKVPCVVRNSLLNNVWGTEETGGDMPLANAEPFDISLLCEPSHIKIQVNGDIFTSYNHRIPLQRATYFSVTGDAKLSFVEFKNINVQEVLAIDSITL